MNNLKKLYFLILFSLFFSFSYANRHNQTDLDFIYKILDAKILMNNYEEIPEKIEYLNTVKADFDSNSESLSQQAKIICNGIITLEIENQKKLLNKETDKKSKNDNPETKHIIFSVFNSFNDYAQNNTDLSSRFLFHYKEAEFATLPYLSNSEQLKIMKNLLNDYRQIEETDPELSENLLYLGMSLYYVPKILGGSKIEAEEKLQKAIETSQCLYEKISSMLMYSQLIYERKQTQKSREMVLEMIKLAPENKGFSDLLEMNDKGYSIFEAQKFNDKYKKN